VRGVTGYDVSVHRVTAYPLAAVRDRMAARDIPARFRRSLDKVWDYLRAHPGLRTDGHNVFVYRHDMDSGGAMSIDFGVQVTRAFADGGGIRCVITPDGEVASTIHIGPYDGLKGAHEAVHARSAANSRRAGGWNWEIYGDWDADPQKIKTQILYLLD
jgi:hypothetical protein